jgi:hypothetical protein
MGQSYDNTALGDYQPKGKIHEESSLAASEPSYTTL